MIEFMGNLLLGLGMLKKWAIPTELYRCEKLRPRDTKAHIIATTDPKKQTYLHDQIQVIYLGWIKSTSFNSSTSL